MKNITQFKMKRVNLIVLILALISTQLLSSCIDKEFKKEFALIKEIMNNPDEVKQIIERSEFYDARFFDLDKDIPPSLIGDIKEGKLKILRNGYIVDNEYKCIRINKIKFITLVKNDYSVFYQIKFVKIGDKHFLTETLDVHH